MQPLVNQPNNAKVPAPLETEGSCSTDSRFSSIRANFQAQANNEQTTPNPTNRPASAGSGGITKASSRATMKVANHGFVPVSNSNSSIGFSAADTLRNVSYQLTGLKPAIGQPNARESFNFEAFTQEIIVRSTLEASRFLDKEKKQTIEDIMEAILEKALDKIDGEQAVSDTLEEIIDQTLQRVDREKSIDAESNDETKFTKKIDRALGTLEVDSDTKVPEISDQGEEELKACLTDIISQIEEQELHPNPLDHAKDAKEGVPELSQANQDTESEIPTVTIKLAKIMAKASKKDPSKMEISTLLAFIKKASKDNKDKDLFTLTKKTLLRKIHRNSTEHENMHYPNPRNDLKQIEILIQKAIVEQRRLKALSYAEEILKRKIAQADMKYKVTRLQSADPSHHQLASSKIPVWVPTGASRPHSANTCADNFKPNADAVVYGLF